MQEKKIYKVSLLILLLSSLAEANRLSHQEITHMVSKIKEERAGITLSQLNDTSNPFILNVIKEEVKKAETVVAKVKKKEVFYGLKAILNKRAFINNKWYKQGDSLGEYKVGHVSSSSVLLKSARGNKTLTLKNKSKSKAKKLIHIDGGKQ